HGYHGTEVDEATRQHHADGALALGRVRPWREGDRLGLIGVLDAKSHRRAEVALGGVAGRLHVHGLALYGDDRVARLQAGLGGGAVGRDVGEGDRTVRRDAWHADEVDHRKRRYGQQEIHARAGGQDDGADAARLTREAARCGGVFFAQHLDEGAERD